jgi:molecular chaperone DnaJ
MPAKDYYEIFGVSKDASPEEIKKKYRELVMKYHPDLNKNNPEAAKKMAEVNEAYQVLSDPDRRAQYDRFGTVGEGVGAPGGGYDFGGYDFGGGGFFDGVEDILRNFGFGVGGFREETGERVARGMDIDYPLTITFKEAVLGTTREISVNRKETCSRCHGDGVEPGAGYSTCPTCKGSGVIKNVQRTIFGQFVVQSTCHTCHGSGKVPKEKCHTCGGSGVVSASRKVEVKIPAGVDDGMRVRIRGQGNAAEHGGIAGDLFIHIRVTHDRRFVREGDRIYYSVSISIPDAVLGTIINIPLIEDGEEKLRIPPGTQSGTEIPVRGKGSYQVGSRRRGDLIVRVFVEIPSRLSREEAGYFEKLREIYSAKKN